MQHWTQDTDLKTKQNKTQTTKRMSNTDHTTQTGLNPAAQDVFSLTKSLYYSTFMTYILTIAHRGSALGMNADSVKKMHSVMHTGNDVN